MTILSHRHTLVAGLRVGAMSQTFDGLTKGGLRLVAVGRYHAVWWCDRDGCF